MGCIICLTETRELNRSKTPARPRPLYDGNPESREGGESGHNDPLVCDPCWARWLETRKEQKAAVWGADGEIFAIDREMVTQHHATRLPIGGPYDVCMCGQLAVGGAGCIMKTCPACGNKFQFVDVFCDTTRMTLALLAAGLNWADRGYFETCDPQDIRRLLCVAFHNGAVDVFKMFVEMLVEMSIPYKDIRLGTHDAQDIRVGADDVRVYPFYHQNFATHVPWQRAIAIAKLAISCGWGGSELTKVLHPIMVTSYSYDAYLAYVALGIEPKDAYHETSATPELFMLHALAWANQERADLWLSGLRRLWELYDQFVAHGFVVSGWPQESLVGFLRTIMTACPLYSDLGLRLAQGILSDHLADATASFKRTLLSHFCRHGFVRNVLFHDIQRRHFADVTTLAGTATPELESVAYSMLCDLVDIPKGSVVPFVEANSARLTIRWLVFAFCCKRVMDDISLTAAEDPQRAESILLLLFPSTPSPEDANRINSALGAFIALVTSVSRVWEMDRLHAAFASSLANPERDGLETYIMRCIENAPDIAKKHIAFLTDPASGATLACHRAHIYLWMTRRRDIRGAARFGPERKMLEAAIARCFAPDCKHCAQKRTVGPPKKCIKLSDQ